MVHTMGLCNHRAEVEFYKILQTWPSMKKVLRIFISKSQLNQVPIESSFDVPEHLPSNVPQYKLIRIS